MDINVRQYTLWSLVGALGASALIAIFGVITEAFSDVVWRILSTVWLVSGTAMIILPGLLHLQRQRHVPFAVGLVGSSLITSLFLFTLIWFDYTIGKAVAKTMATIGIAALSLFAVNMTSFANLGKRFAWLNPTGMVINLFFTLQVLGSIWFEEDPNAKLMLVTAILMMTSWGLTPLFHMLSKSDQPPGGGDGQSEDAPLDEGSAEAEVAD